MQLRDSQLYGSARRNDHSYRLGPIRDNTNTTAFQNKQSVFPDIYYAF